MSHRDNVDVKYIESEYSSGDSKNVKSKRYQEENNNEVDELSKDLSEMGCIVDAVKRPPNICVESYVCESDNEKSGGEDAYSDEFEEANSEEDDETVKTEMKSMSDTIREDIITNSAAKLSKSQSTISSNKQPPSESTSGRSTSFGSSFGPTTRRVNMSFTNERLREIQRHNHILLTKILSARNTRKSSIPTEQVPRKPIPSAAVSRKNQQRKIDHDNMGRPRASDKPAKPWQSLTIGSAVCLLATLILLKKIQRAKSSAYSTRR